MTKDEIIKSFSAKVGSDWLSICLDGSGFDSTQNIHVMRAVDNVFMNKMYPGLVHLM